MDDAVHSVGFEPTSTNTFELESNPLDRSGKNAVSIAHLDFDTTTFGLWAQHASSAPVSKQIPLPYHIQT